MIRILLLNGYGCNKESHFAGNEMAFTGSVVMEKLFYHLIASFYERCELLTFE